MKTDCLIPSHQGVKFNLILPKLMKGSSAAEWLHKATRTPHALTVQHRGFSLQLPHDPYAIT